jgi:uncharacterized protein YuzE
MGCSILLDGGPLSEGKFYVQRLDTNRFDVIDAEKLYTGEHCIIYKDSRLDNSYLGQNVSSFTNEFDTVIYPRVTGCFGEPLDVDRNGKIIILLLEIKSSGGGDTTKGYFWSGDMYETVDYSNRADMLYIDGTDVNIGSSNNYTYETVAHELQHLINFSARFTMQKEAMETWIDEGLSTAAEYVYLGRHPTLRVDWFNISTTAVRNGNTFFFWNRASNQEDKNDDTRVTDYASAYAFFQWLRIQAAEGDTAGAAGGEIFRDIIGSPYSDCRAVTNAIVPRLLERDGYAEWAAWRGKYGDWPALLGAWFAANLLCDASGPYGYKGDAGIRPVIKSPNTQTFNTLLLSPGEGVYSMTTASSKFSNLSNKIPGETGHIHYLYVKDSSVTFTRSLGEDVFAGGKTRIISFNANTASNGDREAAWVDGDIEDFSRSAAPRESGTTPAPRLWVCGTARARGGR